MSRKHCVFISCVSSEFEQLRERLSKTLALNPDVEVITQEKLRREHGMPILLDMLHKEVKRSNMVLCIQGKRSGECPPERAASKYTRILQGSMVQASFTQWELFYAMYYRKTYHIFRASETYKPEQPEGTDVPGLQVQFLEFVNKTGAYRGEKTFETEADVLGEVLTLDWRRSPPLWAALLSFSSFFFVFVVTFLALNASKSTNANIGSIYSDMFSPDTFFRPSVEPSLSYFISGYGDHTLLIARPSRKKGTEIDLTIPRSLHPVGCPDSPAPGAAGDPGDCLFTWTPRDALDPEEEDLPQPVWPFWLMNTPGRSDAEAQVSAILKHDGAPTGPWSVRFRDDQEGGPCVTGSLSKDCFAEHLHRRITGFQDKDDFSRELYYGHAELKSNYQSASESFNRAAFLAIFGFSLLISWMEREVIKIDLAAGKAWQLAKGLFGT